MREGKSRKNTLKVILTAFLANLVIAAAKTIAALATGSASMGAEAIHSIVDTGNEILLYIGHRRSLKPPSPKHPLGHGREAFFWSFIVAMLLFSLGGLYTIYEGIDHLQSQEFTNPLLNLGVLAVAGLSEGFSLRSAIKRIRSSARHINLVTWFKRSTTPELLVVFAEDTAAIAGISIAALGVILSWATQNYIWDGIGSIGVGLILITGAFALANEIRSLMIGESPAKNYRADIDRLVAEVIPGSAVKTFIAIQIGSDEVIMSYKITRGTVDSARELIERLKELEKKVGECFPEVRWQFIYPVPSS